MKRREFCKGVALVPASGALLSIPRLADAATAGKAAPAGTAAAKAPSGGSSGTGEVPGFAEHMLTTDMNGLGPDGKPTGQAATFTGASKAGATAASASSKMQLTADEQAVLDGKEGPEKAKLMKILVRFGETFGATKLVDLGGAPHSNLYIGAPYMASLIDMLQQCAEAGLKSYAPYTVNPRPYDVYNVQNNPTDMELIYQGYPEQMRLDWVHSKLGAPDLNQRSCACYIDDIGNRPEPGTAVAWCESSAVNYGNSVLGIRTNRYGAGMEMICALLGKAPHFGLMTEEGRKATWLVEIKTTGEQLVATVKGLVREGNLGLLVQVTHGARTWIDLLIASITESSWASSIATSTLILGRKSTTYSAPRYNSVWPFCRPKPFTSVTVIPCTPISERASRTSSSLKGLMIAVTIFMGNNLRRVGPPKRAARYCFFNLLNSTASRRHN